MRLADLYFAHKCWLSITHRLQLALVVGFPVMYIYCMVQTAVHWHSGKYLIIINYDTDEATVQLAKLCAMGLSQAHHNNNYN